MFKKICFFVFCSTTANAQVFSNKGAELPLQVIETPHFEVIHNVRLEDYARRVAAAAEKIFASVIKITGNNPGKTTILVGDETDVFNGYALPGPDPFIRVYATFPRPEDIGVQWEDDAVALVGHEFLHVSHLTTREPLRELVRQLFGPIPGITDARVPPAWFVEGYAVYAETKLTSGGRSQDASVRTLRAQMARADQWPSLSDAGIGPSNSWPFGNTRYAFGAGFVPFLIERFGEEGIQKVIRAYNGPVISFDDAWQNVHKISLTKLWKEWQEQEKNRAEKEKNELIATGLPSGETVKFARSSRAPVWNGDKVAWWQSSAINIGEKHYLLPSKPDRLSWIDNESLIYSRNYAENGKIIGEVFKFKDGIEQKLTQNAHARDAIAYNGCIFYVKDDFKNSSLHKICQESETEIFKAPNNWHIFQPMPGKNGIAMSIWRPGGFLDIAIFNNELEFITSDRAQDIWPYWDGDDLIFSSDRNGSFQVYRFENGNLSQLTASFGGVYNFSFDQNNSFYFSSYANDGYSIQKIEKLPDDIQANITAVLQPVTSVLQPVIKTEPIAINDLDGKEFVVKTYQPRLKPIIWYPFGDGGLGATILGADQAGIISYQLSSDLPVLSLNKPGFSFFSSFKPNTTWDFSLESTLRSDSWSFKFSPNYRAQAERSGVRFDYSLTPWFQTGNQGPIFGLKTELDAINYDDFGYVNQGFALNSGFNSRNEIDINLKMAAKISTFSVNLQTGLFAGPEKLRADVNLSTRFSIDLNWRFPDGVFALERLTFAPFFAVEQTKSLNFGGGSEILIDGIFNYYVPISIGLSLSYWTDGFRIEFLSSIPLLNKLG